MKIRILSDMGEVYDPGTEMDAKTLINDYIEANAPDNELETFLHSVTTDTALQFIHDMWGIDYEEC